LCLTSNLFTKRNLKPGEEGAILDYRKYYSGFKVLANIGTPEVPFVDVLDALTDLGMGKKEAEELCKSFKETHKKEIKGNITNWYFVT
jgi:hypothetical protein